MSAFDEWAKSPDALSRVHAVTLRDAFNAGMTRAAAICRVEAEIYHADDYAQGKEAGCNDCADAILKARDGV